MYYQIITTRKEKIYILEKDLLASLQWAPPGKHVYSGSWQYFAGVAVAVTAGEKGGTKLSWLFAASAAAADATTDAQCWEVMAGC